MKIGIYLLKSGRNSKSAFPLGMNSDIQGVGSADSTKLATCCWTREEEARWDAHPTEEIRAASWLPMG